MNARMFSPMRTIVIVMSIVWLGGCATSGYSPPPERHSRDRCPPSEVWVCEDRYPSRVEGGDRADAFCRCEHPSRIH
jgi:hypothetical protein